VKHYKNGQELNAKILKGIDILADNVASTLGPKGRNVILYHREENVPVITKDGVTVAKFVELEDPFENVGAQIIKQAAAQTNDTAGDGTTTSTVLARGILKRAQKYLMAGASPIELKRGIDVAVSAIVDSLKEMATPIQSEQDIAHIATISANNDKAIGTLVATAVDRAGKDGSVLVEEARSLETSLDLIEGFRFDSGYAASAFITNERSGAVEYENPMMLVTDEKLEHVDQILPVLELAARESRPLLIVSSDIEGQALAALIMNSVRGTMKVAAVKAPRYGEERRRILKDLCLSIGATMITRENSLTLKDVKLAHFGGCKKVSVTKGWTTVVGGKGSYDEIEKKIDALKIEIKETDGLQECERIQERITRLASGIAVIRVGAATEVEMIEKKHRIDDALEAVRSAQEEGIVPGGGTALIHASTVLRGLEADNDEQNLGIKIILEAIEEPLRQMCLNAGESPDIVVEDVKNIKISWGYDFMQRKMVNLLESGIIDPVKVTRCALQNAASVSSTLITTNHAIVCH
jgi:chaperonin GroEL